MNNDALLNKIKALLRLADPKRGASEAEAQLALSKAQELMTLHGIEQVHLGFDDEEVAKQNFNFEKQTFKTGRQRYEQDAYIWRIIEQCFGVKMLQSSYSEYVKTKRHYGAYKSRQAWIILGTPLEVEIAKAVIEYLHPTMRRSCRDYIKRTGKQWSANIAYSHYAGITSGYITASEEGQKLARGQATKKDADAYALVLVSKKDALAKFTKELYPNTKYARGAQENYIGDHGAFNDGFECGSKMQLQNDNKLK